LPFVYFKNYAPGTPGGRDHLKDETEFFADPIAPPKSDRWGPGSRIPAIFISPHVKRGFVDHTIYETTSILAFLEKRFEIEPLTDRKAKANPLSGIFLR